MPSPGDLQRVSGLIARRAERLRVQARQAEQRGNEQRAQARQLQAQALQMLDQGALCEEHGLQRQQLFDRLRTLAVARAHALDAQQQAGQQLQRAAQMLDQARQLQAQSRGQQGRARCLAAVQDRLHRQQQRERGRRQERQAQEEHACQ